MNYLLVFVAFIVGIIIGEDLPGKEAAARESTSKTTCWIDTMFTKKIEEQYGPAPNGFKYCLVFKGPVNKEDPK